MLWASAPEVAGVRVWVGYVTGTEAASPWGDLESGGLTFKKPDPTIRTSFEAYDLIVFEVVPKAGRAHESFLFKHGLEWTWTISFADDRSRSEELLKVTTREPRVTQFIPVRTGNVHAEVHVTRGAAKPLSCTLPEEALDIKASTEFGATRAFERAESIALGMAAAVAVISGTQSTIYEKALLGSLESLGGLFIWGIAAEQTKNFLENIKTYTGATDTT